MKTFLLLCNGNETKWKKCIEWSITPAASFVFFHWINFINSIPERQTDSRSHKYKKYYNCIFSIECNLRKHGAVTNQTTWNSIQRHWISLIVWFGWPAVWRKRQAKPTKKINFINLICWWRQLERPSNSNQTNSFFSLKRWIVDWICLLLAAAGLTHSFIQSKSNQKQLLIFFCFHSGLALPPFLHWKTSFSYCGKGSKEKKDNLIELPILKSNSN